MTDPSRELRPSDYSFVVERVAKRLRVRYLVLVGILAVLPFAVETALSLSIIYLDKAYYLWPYFISGLAWRVPGILALLVTSILARMLRNKTVASMSPVFPFISRKDSVLKALSRTFETQHHWIAAALFAIAAAVVQVFLLILVPQPGWTIWYDVAFAQTLVLATSTTVSTAITYFFIGMMGYFCLSTSHLIVVTADNFRSQLRIQDSDRAGFKQMGELFRALGISWMLGVGLLLGQLVGASATSFELLRWLTLLQLSAFFVTAAALVLIPLQAIHRVMVRIKETADGTLNELRWDKFEQLKSFFSDSGNSRLRGKITNLALLLKSLDVYQERIDRIPVWPMNAVLTAELAIAVLVQVLSVFLNILLSRLTRVS